MRSAIMMRRSGNSKGNIRSHRTESMQCMWIRPTVGFPRNYLTLKIVIGALTRLKFFTKTAHRKQLLLGRGRSVSSSSPNRPPLFTKNKKGRKNEEFSIFYFELSLERWRCDPEL